MKTIHIFDGLKALIAGVFHDLKVALVLFWVCYLIRYLFQRGFKKDLKDFKIATQIYTLLVVFILSFQMCAEWIFWQDMECRFNFIAIDYLIYTHEVVNNILQSYPVKTYLVLMMLTSVGITYLVKRVDFNLPVLKKNLFFGSFLVLGLHFVDPINWTRNNFAIELGQNGTYNLIHAFFHNQLEYEKFYRKNDPKINLKKVQKYLGVKTFKDSIDPIQRPIQSEKGLNKLNVVLIAVESLSQEFLDNQPTWTPFIKEVESHSISFLDHYATGTRTVRGLEALTLCVPPTPGSSILRRPHHANLYSVSSVLKPLNYRMEFWYGGYGYFDNMNAFFEKNGFDVKDRLSIPSEKIAHETIWGVSDEHLFDAFIEHLDNTYDAEKPFFSLIMTTSNHRPYTFPKNRIEMPMGTRESAVRYTDWAIQQFINSAKSKPWFDNTLFVITADHCASSAGKLKVDPKKYLTPCLFYSPKNLEPKKITTRTSQIDVIPSILGILGVTYESRFYGTDQIHNPIDRAVPIGTYQRLGYFSKDEFVILSPKKEVEIYKINKNRFVVISNEESQQLEDAIALYQTASDRYQNGLMDDK